MTSFTKSLLSWLTAATASFTIWAQSPTLGSIRYNIPQDSLKYYQKPCPLNLKAALDIAKYPRMAQDNGITGEVIATLLVETDGKCTVDSILYSPHLLLTDYVESFVKRLRFSPAMYMGKPMRMRVDVPIIFSMPKGQATQVDSLLGFNALIPKTVPLDDLGAYTAPYPLNYKNIFQHIQYPRSMQKEGVSGSVLVNININEEGRYTSHRVIYSADEILTEAVLEQIPYFRFAPAHYRGKPIESSFVMRIVFVSSTANKTPEQRRIERRIACISGLTPVVVLLLAALATAI